MANHPPLQEKYLSRMDELLVKPSIQKALEIPKEQEAQAIEEQIALCEIPAPTFHEKERGEELLKRFREYGLSDVRMDEIGNVIGRRKGKGNGPVVAVAAHMDTVFPEGTDVKVRREGNILRAPGIGDNCSGLRALLQVMRMYQEAGIETEGDILFVASVGEEGNGDIRGAKHFVANNHIDAFLAIDSTDVGRVLRGAIGSRRWRVSIDGTGGHSYADFGKIPSAIHAMCLAGARIAKIKVPAEPKTTFTIGTIKGGTSVNTLAGHCEADVDIRSLDPAELAKAEAQIHQAFRDAVEEENGIWNLQDPNLQLKVSFTQIGDRPAGMRPDDCPVLQSARTAQKVLGIALTNYGVSSTDANAPVAKNIPATCLCSGGIGRGAHSLKESFEIKDTYLGPQLVFLTSALLAGAEGVPPSLKD